LNGVKLSVVEQGHRERVDENAVTDLDTRSRGEGLEECMNDDAGRELAVFTDAVKVPRQQRAAFLDQACGRDHDLRRKVESLLRAHDRVGNFLEEPPTGGPSNASN
jgi:hypothetical protein